MSDYDACTDCGIDTRTLREQWFQIRPSVWALAYPDYNDGVGFGSSRPCIGCLERRLKRPLRRNDFTAGDINEPNPTVHSARLIDRLTSIYDQQLFAGGHPTVSLNERRQSHD